MTNKLIAWIAVVCVLLLTMSCASTDRGEYDELGAEEWSDWGEGDGEWVDANDEWSDWGDDWGDGGSDWGDSFDQHAGEELGGFDDWGDDWGDDTWAEAGDGGFDEGWGQVEEDAWGNFDDSWETDVVAEELSDPAFGGGWEDIGDQGDGYIFEDSGFSSDFSSAPLQSIRDIRYLADVDGGVIVVETDSPVSYQTREVLEQNQVVLELMDANLPEHLKRPYVTTDFGGSIASFNAYQDPGSTVARIVVQFNAYPNVQVSQDGSILTLNALGSGFQGDDGWDLPEVAKATEPRQAPATEDITRILPERSSDLSNRNRFYGKPISIEVVDTSVRDVINLIMEQSGANLVLTGQQDQSISLRLREIPWDQALLVVMQTANLGYVRQGSVLRIAPFVDLRRESEEARAAAEAQQRAQPLRVKVIPISYAKIEELVTQMEPFLVGEKSRVVGDVRTSSLLVTDTVDNLERIERLIRSLDTPPLQVLIEGKVIEATETFARNVGIEWNSTGRNVELGDYDLRGDIRSSPSIRDAATGSIDLTFGTLDVIGDLAARLALFEQQDMANIVSSPRIMAMNNQSASIVQSTNIAIVQDTISASGETVRQTTYQPVELRLQVTPQITVDGDIMMDVLIKREFPVGTGGAAPNINAREAQTNVMVRNGQTAVIGGIYQADNRSTDSGVPFLRQIPVLGWLFKSWGRETDKNELLLFLTPQIVSSAEREMAGTDFF